jgi:hypothetical protein
MRYLLMKPFSRSLLLALRFDGKNLYVNAQNVSLRTYCSPFLKASRISLTTLKSFSVLTLPKKQSPF